MNAKNALPLLGYAAFAAVLLSPIRHYAGSIEKVTRAKENNDSFPLSTYPMFSADRQGKVTIAHVVGITASGKRVIPHYRHFGAGGLNQVRRQISAAFRDGRATDVAQQYADSLHEAQQTGAAKKAERKIVEVRAVRSRFRFEDWFDGERHPYSEGVYATCKVGEKAQPGNQKMRLQRKTKDHS